jgi:hypothetical protein
MGEKTLWRRHNWLVERAGDAVGWKRTGCENSAASATERVGRELDADTEPLANLAG